MAIVGPRSGGCIKVKMFPYPNQSLIAILSGPDNYTNTSGRCNGCNLGGPISNCLPPPNASLPRETITLHGITFSDPQLGNFMLFTLPTSEQTLVRSADILIAPQDQSTYFNLYVQYIAKAVDNNPVMVSFYTSDPIYGTDITPRFRLLPDIFNGQLSQYHTINNTLIFGQVTTFMIKVSDNITNMTLILGIIPTDAFVPCANSTLYICSTDVMNDCCNCEKEAVLSYPITDDGFNLTLIPVGRFIQIREELKHLIDETSTGTLLPLIPSRLTPLQDMPQPVIFDGAELVCTTTSPSNILVTYTPRNDDPNWSGNIVDGYEICLTDNTPIRNGRLGYNTGESVNHYRLMAVALDLVAYNPSFDIFIQFLYPTGFGAYSPYKLLGDHCQLTDSTTISAGTITQSEQIINVTAVLPRDSKIVVVEVIGRTVVGQGFDHLSNIITRVQLVPTCPI